MHPVVGESLAVVRITPQDSVPEHAVKGAVPQIQGQIVDVFVQQITNESVEAETLITQECPRQRTVEALADVSAPRTQEQADVATKVFLQERVSELNVEQVEVIPVPPKHENAGVDCVGASRADSGLHRGRERIVDPSRQIGERDDARSGRQFQQGFAIWWRENIGKELRDRAATTQDISGDAVENAEVHGGQVRRLPCFRSFAGGVWHHRSLGSPSHRRVQRCSPLRGRNQ